ncbi:MAG: hypothetical protein EZS28_020282 [Streblomastix strix]|uniref:Uncharacterized protein n=1 Tax=Streblomastix strix TaxID=222440 RepID=A0A5J4VNK3_9EUKA|nr:MAG: hypothetical protein EZS28_020282 [Streblomastix strix]
MPEENLTQLVQLKTKRNYTVAINPEIVAGDGVVQIQLKFEDLQNLNRGFRQVGIVDSNFDFSDQYLPGQDEFSVGYCGSDGNISHLTEESVDQFITGNDKYENGDLVTLEVNMHEDKEKRTLHFFLKEKQQPISFIGLPDCIKFIVQRQHQGTAVTIISMQTLLQPTIVDNIPKAQIIDW